MVSPVQTARVPGGDIRPDGLMLEGVLQGQTKLCLYKEQTKRNKHVAGRGESLESAD